MSTDETPSDAELHAEYMATRNDTVFRVLYDRHVMAVAKCVWQRYRMSRDEANELAIIALGVLGTKPRKYKSRRGALRPWLVSVAANAWKDDQRFRGRRPAMSTTDKDGGTREVPDDSISSPDDQAELNEHRSKLAAIVATCRPREQEVWRVHAEGMSNPQGAASLGMTPSTFATMLGRVRKRVEAGLTKQ